MLHTDATVKFPFFGHDDPWVNRTATRLELEFLNTSWTLLLNCFPLDSLSLLQLNVRMIRASAFLDKFDPRIVLRDWSVMRRVSWTETEGYLVPHSI
jgi:hypothetical protein